MSTTGWKLVPVEPTEEMARDGSAKIRDFFSQDGVYPRTKAMWAAMLAISPSPASPTSPADDVAGLETIATMLNPSTIAHHREVGGLYGWCELLQSRIRNAAAALSRLQARLAEVTAERDMANKEVNLLLSSAAAKGDEPDLLLRAWHTALDDAATMREALTEANRKIAGMQLAFQEHLAALGGQHG